MKLMAVIALAGGLVAAPVMTAAPAAALPRPCDGAGCVPYVNHGINPSDSCLLVGTRYAFGLDGSGNTYICNIKNQWESAPPLIGVRTLRAPCDANQPGVAQSPEGFVMVCKMGGWTTDFTAMFF